MAFPLRTRGRGRPTRGSGVTSSGLPAPSFRSAASTAAAAGASVVVTKPTGTVDADIMVACGVIVGTSANTQTIVAPGGAAWTLRVGPIDNGTDRRLYLWTRVASSEGADYTFTRTGASAARVTILSFSGGAYDTATSGTNASGTSHTIPSVTTTVANCLAVEFVGAGSGATSQTPPTSYTERSDDAATIFIASASLAYAAAGATGAVTATTGGASASLVAHVSLKPG